MKIVLRSMMATMLLFGAMAAHAAGLTDFNGKPHTISDYTGNGKWLVVMFWAHDCSVCNSDVGDKVKFYQRHRNKDAIVLGVSLDGKENLRGAIDFVRRHRVTFPNLIGEPQDVANLFTQYTGDEWVGTPTFLIFDPQGKVRAEQAGAIPSSLIAQFIRDHSKPVTAKPGTV